MIYMVDLWHLGSVNDPEFDTFGRGPWGKHPETPWT